MKIEYAQHRPSEQKTVFSKRTLEEHLLF